MKLTLAILAASTLLLTGCSDSGETEESSSAESTSASSTATTGSDAGSDTGAQGGAELSGPGFTYTVPAGWKDATERMGAGFYSGAANFDDTADGFSDNINVSPISTKPDSLEALEKAAPRELEAAGATKVTVADRTDIDGEDASQITADMSAQGASYKVNQFYTLNGKGYIITLSTSPELSSSDRQKLIDSILGSWTWTA